jgi:MFS family permease
MRASTEIPKDLRPYLALEAATVMAGVGHAITAIALPWLTLELTDNPAAAGLVVAVASLPQIAASLGSGVLVDRIGRQRASVMAAGCAAVAASLIPLFDARGVLTYALVMLAAVLGALFDPIGYTARQSMLPDVASRAKLSLDRVNSLHQAVAGLAWVIGPVIAGVSIGLVGATKSFWAVAAGFGLSALLMGLARVPTVSVRKDRARWTSEAADGWRYLLRTPAVRSTAVLATLAFTMVGSVAGIALPVVYERLDMPEALSLLFVTYACSTAVGALLYGSFSSRVSRRAAFAFGLAATAIVPLVLSTLPTYPVQLLAMAIGGLFGAVVNPIVNVVMHERAPEEMRGRIQSALSTLSYAAFPFGVLAAGYSIKAFGAPATFAWMGMATVLVALWAAVTPSLRTMGAAEVEPALAETGR